MTSPFTSADADISTGSTVIVSGSIPGAALTWSNLHQHTEQGRQSDAHRRGRSTPSSESDDRSNFPSPPPRVQHVPRTKVTKATWQIEAEAAAALGLPYEPPPLFSPNIDDLLAKKRARQQRLRPANMIAQQQGTWEIEAEAAAAPGLPYELPPWCPPDIDDLLAKKRARQQRLRHANMIGQQELIGMGIAIRDFAGECLPRKEMDKRSRISSSKEREPAHADGVIEIPALKAPGPRPSRSLSRTAPPSTTGPRLPPEFPTYHKTVNINEIGAYLANASYIISMAGTPLADIKYGIIVVPAGEESLLFSPRSADELFTTGFLDAIDDANHAYSEHWRLHGSGCDSDEFLQLRFRDDFPDTPVESFRNLENFRGAPGNFELYPPNVLAKTNGIRGSPTNGGILSAIELSEDLAAPAIRQDHEVAETAGASDGIWNHKMDQTLVKPSSETAQQGQNMAANTVTATHGLGLAPTAPRRSSRVAKRSLPAAKDEELRRLRPRTRRDAPKMETRTPRRVARQPRRRPQAKARAAGMDGNGGV